MLTSVHFLEIRILGMSRPSNKRRGPLRLYSGGLMPKRKARGPSLKETYARIRKPVPPPTRVQKDRKKAKIDEIRRREAAEMTERGNSEI